MCIRPTDFAEICISFKAPRGLPIHKIEEKYRFLVQPNINKTNRIKKKYFLKKSFCHGVDLFCNRPCRKAGKKLSVLARLPNSICRNRK